MKLETRPVIIDQNPVSWDDLEQCPTKPVNLQGLKPVSGSHVSLFIPSPLPFLLVSLSGSYVAVVHLFSISQHPSLLPSKLVPVPHIIEFPKIISMELFNWEKHAGITLLLVSLVLYTIYGAIYRLFLSPLRNFPGPKIAALTSW